MPATAHLPEPGQLVRLRQRRWLVEGIAAPSNRHDATLITATCVDDDAQGARADVLWEHELDTEILDDAGWAKVGDGRFDDPELFAAYARTLRCGCATAQVGTRFEPDQARRAWTRDGLVAVTQARLLPRTSATVSGATMSGTEIFSREFRTARTRRGAACTVFRTTIQASRCDSSGNRVDCLLDRAGR